MPHFGVAATQIWHSHAESKLVVALAEMKASALSEHSPSAKDASLLIGNEAAKVGHNHEARLYSEGVIRASIPFLSCIFLIFRHDSEAPLLELLCADNFIVWRLWYACRSACRVSCLGVRQRLKRR